MQPDPIRFVSPLDPPLTKPVNVTEADLICIMCNRVAGTLVNRSNRLMLIKVGEPALISPNVKGMRCDVCHGSLALGEIVTWTDRPRVPMTPDDEPKLGRPPKWLVEQRKAEAALEASS